MSAYTGLPMPGPGSAAQLRIQIDETGEVPVVSLAGELDMTVAAQLSDALARGRSLIKDRLTVDVSDLAFMDVAGLRALLCEHERLLLAGRAGITVRGASGTVRRIIELCGFTALLGGPPPDAVRKPLSPGAREPARNPGIGRQPAGLSGMGSDEQ